MVNDKFVEVQSPLVGNVGKFRDWGGSKGSVVVYDASTPQFTCRNCGVGDRSRVAIYRPFRGSFIELEMLCHLYMVLKAKRQAYLAHVTMNFVGLNSDYVRQENKSETPLGIAFREEVSLRGINTLLKWRGHCGRVIIVSRTRYWSGLLVHSTPVDFRD
ncbi:hypothetical protein TNCV_2834011 [Trichonephila clavipes]|nr:hypothetical protein TNCV_2834011 [Trichonephila clavipes]